MRESYSFTPPDFPPELRLILACLRITPNKEEVNRIERMSRAQITWPDFLKWVDRHRVAPLVYTNLSRYTDKVPSSIMSQLRRRFQKNARRGLANAAELVRLYKLFQENHIPVLPLKGSVLALQVYGNLAGRHAGDIDLLVAPSQVELAGRLLQSSYRCIMPGFRLSPSQRRRFLRYWHHFEYLHDQGNLRVELHWRSLLNQPQQIMDLTPLQSRASAVTVAGSRLPGISLEDNVLYLCGHGAVHFWHRLFWLLDLAEMMRGNPQIYWPQLMALAREAGMMRPLALGVILAHELLGVPLPEAIRTYSLQDRVLSFSAKVAYRFMLCLQPENPPYSLRLPLYLARLRSANSFQEQLKILADEILTGPDWLTLRLPDSLFFLYYVLRFPLWLQRKLGGSGRQMDRYKVRRKDD